VAPIEVAREGDKGFAMMDQKQDQEPGRVNRQGILCVSAQRAGGWWSISGTVVDIEILNGRFILVG